MLFKRSTALLGLMALAGLASAQSGPKQTYIVQLADPPVATYDGRIAGLAATRPAAGAKLDIRSPNVNVYRRYLATQRAGIVGSLGVRPTHQYDVAFNGFAAQLTPQQVAALRKQSKVLAVVPDELRKLDTLTTPRFLGISTPGGLWSQLDAGGRDIKGEDVIIGIVDSGVWPENASFGDRVDAGGAPLAYHQPGGTLVYGAPPAKWKGVCQTGEGFSAAMCNNKLIGARYYITGFTNGGATPTSLEYRSPRDGDGHGSHTASTAGGNANAPAVLDGVATGAMSGIAPRARIAAYKVCWEATVAAQTGCYTSDSLAAISDAVADGVDVINYSISGTRTNFVDPVEVAFLNAATAGVFVAASAGNAGPANTVAHMSPWLTTVAASTHDRFTVGNVVLGNGASFSGPTYQQTGVAPLPLIRSIDATVGSYAAMTQAEKTAAQRCYLPADGATANTLLDPAKVAGKMVICFRGGNVLINKAALVKSAGGAAMLLQNVPAFDGTPASNNSTVLQPYVVPTVHLTNSSFAAINTYVTTDPAPTASFTAGAQVAGVVAPVMADFSSRGPNLANANILKPDVTAPGVDIVAAVIAQLSQADRDAVAAGTLTPPSNAGSLQGTSMSSPHVAGAAALLKQANPTWSPAAIKSALMTTTTGVKLANGAADPNRFGYGAGHINPNAAVNPGLVYDAGAADYGRFLCGLGLTPPAGIGTCATLGSISAANLNLASMTVADVFSSRTITRRVTNVSGSSATFNASVNMPNWNVTVSPSSLTLAPGATGNFNVTVAKTAATPPNAWTFGTLAWSDGTRTTTSPLSAYAPSFSAPAEVLNETRAAGTRVLQIVSGYTGTMQVVPTGLVPATLNAGLVQGGARQCFNIAVGAGAQVARFQLFNADTQGGASTDIDLVVFNGPNGTGTQVGTSGGSTSDEVVMLTNPAAGTYSACVDGFAVPPGGAAYTLSSWVVGPASGPQSLRAAGPSQVYAGNGASVGLAWSETPGRRYLGTVQYLNPAAAVPLQGTTVFMVNAK